MIARIGLLESSFTYRFEVVCMTAPQPGFHIRPATDDDVESIKNLIAPYVQQRKLFTPGPREGILPGIVRGLVLEAARDSGLRVHEGKVRLRRLEQADEAFLTSSVRGVRPLIEYQRRPVGNGAPGPVTRDLAARVARHRGLPEPKFL